MGDVPIPPGPVVGGIQAQDAQEPGQLAYIDIHNKSPFWNGAGAEVAGQARVYRWLQGVDVQGLAWLGDVIEIHRPAIKYDPSDFSVRRSQGFEDILDRSPAGQGVVHSPILAGGGQKLGQLAMEMQSA